MSAVERAIDELGRRFLGKLGIVAFTDGEENGVEVVIAMVAHTPGQCDCLECDQAVYRAGGYWYVNLMSEPMWHSIFRPHWRWQPGK